jgi:hypothetical protein
MTGGNETECHQRSESDTCDGEKLLTEIHVITSMTRDSDSINSTGGTLPVMRLNCQRQAAGIFQDFSELL